MESSGIRLWLILWKAYDTLRRHAERNIRSLDLDYSAFAVLELLLNKGPAPINRIGSRVGLTSGSITNAVDRLERKGLVERRSHPTDRRTRMVHLTATGRNLISHSFAGHEAALERATSGLTPAERGQAVDLLKKLGLTAKALLDAED